jgi:hypothetical protein
MARKALYSKQIKYGKQGKIPFILSSKKRVFTPSTITKLKAVH